MKTTGNWPLTVNEGKFKFTRKTTRKREDKDPRPAMMGTTLLTWAKKASIRPTGRIAYMLLIACFWWRGFFQVGKTSTTPFFLDAGTSTHTLTSIPRPSASLPYHNNDNDNMESDGNNIRRWGCRSRSETPLIFVHIGKAGGGSVRPRIAAAALDYRRARGRRAWKDHLDRRAYYNISVRPSSPATSSDDDKNNNNKTITYARGYFCNSAFKHFRTDRLVATYEGTRVCHAVTPLGQAVACPMVTRHFAKCLGCAIGDEQCHRVYTGHNLLGNELHWLPPRYLYRWWKGQGRPQQQTQQSSFSVEEDWHGRLLQQGFALIQHENRNWCPALQLSRLQDDDEYEEYYHNCSVPLANQIDDWAHQWLLSQRQQQQQQQRPSNPQQRAVDNDMAVEWTDNFPSSHNANWGPLYASMPLLRITVVREPFSWLLSKFYWHDYQSRHDCHNVTAAVWAHGRHWHVGEHDELERARPGWAHWTARLFLLYLCGEDCQVRWEIATTRLGGNFTARHEKVLLDAFERQADYNLRHSFAVVGLNGDMEEFHDMVSARVQYLDALSRNLHRVRGNPHKSSATDECKALFQRPAFQEQLVQGSPAVAAVVRLYRTAVRVNAFQKQELQTCMGS